VEAELKEQAAARFEAGQENFPVEVPLAALGATVEASSKLQAALPQFWRLRRKELSPRPGIF